MAPTLLHELLLTAERDLDERGWDQPAMLAAIGFSARPGAAQGSAMHLEMNRIPVEVEGYPASYLQQLGYELTMDPAVAEDIATSYPGLIALAAVTESWMAPPDITDEQRRQLAATGRGYADLPGATEVRTIAVLDVKGRRHLLMRERGRQPRIFDGNQDDNELDGGIFLGLAAIFAGLSPFFPYGKGEKLKAIHRDLFSSDAASGTDAEQVRDRR